MDELIQRAESVIADLDALIQDAKDGDAPREFLANLEAGRANIQTGCTISGGNQPPKC